MKYLFASLIFFCLSLSTTMAQEYPLYITDDGYIVVGVTLCDSVPANFMLDTGGGANVLSQKTFDKVKNFATEKGHFTGFRHDGDRLDGVVYELTSLAIGEKVQHQPQVGIYPPLDSYGVEGLVSLKFFEDKPFTIDFKEKKLRFPDQTELSALAADATVIPLTFNVHTDIALDMFIPVCINDEVEATTLFDTGSGYGSLILHPYYLSRLVKDSSALKTQAYTTPLSQQESQDKILELQKVDVCDDEAPTSLEMTGVTAIFREGMIHEGLMGSGMFRDRVITIDIPGKRLLVQR
jgi:hypothetical protein